MNEYQMQSWLCWFNALLLTAHLAGCGDGPPCQNVWKSRAALAIAEAEQPIAKPPVAAVQPAIATKIPTDATDRRRRILYFGSSSCPACRVADASLDRLAERGWKIGSEPDNHIQTVMIDATREEQEFAQQWNVNSVPTWIVWQDGQERERRTGVLDPFEIGRLFGE